MEAVLEHPPLPAPTNRRPVGALPATLEIVATIVQPGGWMPGSGLMHSTYETDVSGRVRVISRTHLYHAELGRDLYPTKEQFELLQQGKRVKLGMQQWA